MEKNTPSLPQAEYQPRALLESTRETLHYLREKEKGCKKEKKGKV